MWHAAWGFYRRRRMARPSLCFSARWRALAGLAFASGALAGCGGSTPSSHDYTTAAVPPPGAPGHATIPITVRQTPAGSFLLVTVAVGGGKAVPVLLDTGSNGLAILRQAVGGRAAVQSRVQRLGAYGAEGIPTRGRLARGLVTIEGSPAVTTVKPVTFGAITSFGVIGRILAMEGAEGIMGVGQLPPSSTGAWSPVLLLRAPLSDGYTIALNAPGGPQLILGRPVKAKDSVTLPLLGPRVVAGPWGGPQTPRRYPDGSPAYQGLFKLCWRVVQRHACGTTLADTGSPQGFVGESVIPGLAHVGAMLAPGIPITVSTPPPRSIVVRSFVTSTQSPELITGYAAEPLSGVLGTGSSIYTTNTVAYDLAAGQIILTPTQH